MSERIARQALLGASAAAALTGFGGLAYAQAADQGADAGAENRVIVTGSRVPTDGSAQPTPVTVVSIEQLQTSAPTTVADALNQLPVFQNSLRPSTTGSSATGQAGNGGNYLNLRSLGPNRTLTLLDGRRVPMNASGWTDVNLFPQLLVQRVDVVNGGASAAYGSDAVSGVVNFILDGGFEGVKLTAQQSTSAYEDANSYRIGAAWGGRLMDDRLRLLASAEKYKNDGVFLDYAGRGWAEQGWGIIPNPGGNPSQIFAPDVATSNAAPGALINGPAAFANITFTPDGTPIPFRAGALRSASVMSGGDGGRARTNLETGVETATFFGRATFDVTDALEVYLQAAVSRVETRFQTSGGSLLFGTIFSGNAYLPASIQAQMTAGNVASLSFGRLNTDFGGARPYNRTDTTSITAGFEQELGGAWSLSGYAAIGRADQLRTQDDTNVIIENFYRAIDAVRAPNGQIVCRSTLTVPTDGCVPLNIFGSGSPSRAAVDYVTGAATAEQDVEQDVAALDIRGQLPGLAAGPLGVAAGVEYRREYTVQTVDPISLSIIRNTNIRGMPAGFINRPGGFWVTNPQPLEGEFDVTEGYVEVAAPIFSEAPLAHALDVNAAVRHADYSTAGGATTWKLGFVWAPIEDVRFRVSRSRDIRAPNLAELFTSSQQTIGTQVRDPQQNGLLVAVTRQTRGNRDLVPETAENLTAGVVFQPRFLPGFTASVDFYDIEISDAIIAPTAQNIVDGCARGDQALCALVIRDAGVILTVVTPTLNVAEFSAQGYDFEASYSTTLLGGDLSLRALATYVAEFAETASGATLDRAGELGPTNGVPEWRGTLGATWRRGPFQVNLQERYIGSGLYNKTFGPAQLSTADNEIEEVFYTDATVTFDVPTGLDRSQLFLTVNNLFNQDPPIVPTGAVTFPRASNGYIYDLIGRYYTAGIRLTF
jgi:outer membrane receptor protein involved in Fe transport